MVGYDDYISMGGITMIEFIIKAYSNLLKVVSTVGAGGSTVSSNTK